MWIQKAISGGGCRGIMLTERVLIGNVSIGRLYHKKHYSFHSLVYNIPGKSQEIVTVKKIQKIFR